MTHEEFATLHRRQGEIVDELRDENRRLGEELDACRKAHAERIKQWMRVYAAVREWRDEAIKGDFVVGQSYDRVLAYMRQARMSMTEPEGEPSKVNHLLESEDLIDAAHALRDTDNRADNRIDYLASAIRQIIRHIAEQR